MKSYLCIGGPLDGLHASSEDFGQSFDWRKNNRDKWGKVNIVEGQFFMHRDLYFPYNSAGGQTRGRSSMLWIYGGLIQKPIPVPPSKRRK